jgi:hypothetical protein
MNTRGRGRWMIAWLPVGRARSALLPYRQTSLRNLKLGKQRGRRNAVDSSNRGRINHHSEQSPITQTLATDADN